MLEPNLQRKLFLKDFSAAHLPTILSNIDSSDSMVANTWLETLLDIIKVLPKDVINSKILPFCVSRGQPSQPLSSRLSVVKLIAELCPFIDDKQLKLEILPLVRSLCHDENDSVRAAVCSILHWIYPSYEDYLESEFCDLVSKLFQDKSWIVQNAIFVECVTMASLLKFESLIRDLYKKFLDHIDRAINLEYRLLPQVAKFINVITHLTEGISLISEKIWFVECYNNIIELVAKDEPPKFNMQLSCLKIEDDDTQNVFLQSRINAAESFLGIVKFCSNFQRLDLLYPALSKLVNDSNLTVRQKVAENFDVIALCFKEQITLVADSLNLLLRDCSIVVIRSLVPNIALILKQLVEAKIIGPAIDSESTAELCDALLKCESKIFSETLDWQLYVTLLEQFEYFPKCFPYSVIYNNFCLLLFERMTLCKALPCRLATTRTLLVYLRYNINLDQCNEIRKQLIGLSRSSNFYERMLFVKSCSTAVKIFSSYYFSDHFLQDVLKLVDDKVANIRLAVVFLIPQISKVVRLNGDSLDQLETILQKLSQDSDKEISFQVELLGSVLQEDLSKELFQSNEAKLKEEKSLTLSRDLASIAPSSFVPFSSEQKKNRWSTLTKLTKSNPNNSKMSLVNSSSSKCSYADVEMDFMIDAGVPFSKTISFKTPNLYNPNEPTKDSFKSSELLPVTNIPLMQSYHIPPILPLYFPFDRRKEHLKVFDVVNNYYLMSRDTESLIVKNYGDSNSYSCTQHSENLMKKHEDCFSDKNYHRSSSTYIPKSKSFKNSFSFKNRNEDMNVIVLNDRVLEKGLSCRSHLRFGLSGSGFIPSHRKNNGPRYNTNEPNSFPDKSSEFQMGRSYLPSLKSSPKSQVKIPNPGSPSSVNTLPRNRSQSPESSFSSPARPMFFPGNTTKSKKYNSRLPVRSVKRDSLS